MSFIKKDLPAWAFPGVLLALWEAAARLLDLPAHILPPPSAVAAAMVESFPLLMMHTRYTLAAVAGGLAIAIILAFVLAVAMDRFRPVKRAIYPLLVVSQAVPIFALAPLILIWFGAGLAPKVLIVALVSFFPLTVNLVEGLEQVDPEAIDLLKTMRAPPLMILRTAQIPATLPYFFSGLKIAATYSVMGAIIGEWLAARAGLGIYMLRSMHSFRTSHLFASIVVVVALSLFLFMIVELAGRLAMPWHQKHEEKSIEWSDRQ